MQPIIEHAQDAREVVRVKPHYRAVLIRDPSGYVGPSLLDGRR